MRRTSVSAARLTETGGDHLQGRLLREAVHRAEFERKEKKTTFQMLLSVQQVPGSIKSFDLRTVPWIITAGVWNKNPIKCSLDWKVSSNQVQIL